MNLSKNVLSIFVLISVLGLESQSLWAKGGRASGGGNGCRANFMAAHHEVTLWFKANGSGLNPQILEEDYKNSVTLDDLIELDAETPLNDQNGLPVTAYYDDAIQKILIRCDRFDRENPVGRKRTVGHEALRKLVGEREGDHYGVSKLIFSKTDEMNQLQYSIGKSVVVMKFEGDSRALVKISTTKDGVEFFSLKDCPLSAIHESGGSLDIAYEDCSQVGKSFYKTQDAEKLYKKFLSVVEEVAGRENDLDLDGKARIYLATAFVANGLSIWAADASAVKGFKQLGEFHDRVIRRMMAAFGKPQLSRRHLMITKYILSMVSIGYGLYIAHDTIDMKSRSGDANKTMFESTGVKLKSGNGYASFGLGFILDFKQNASRSKLATPAMRKLLIETLTTIEESGLLKGYTQF